jgi:ATP-binding cassette subfamily F protein 3
LIEVDDIDRSAMRFRFPPAPHSGKVVLKAQGVSKSFDEKHVLINIDLNISRGEKIAFVGQNGQGKSTLVKILVGELEASGKIERGHQVHLGYYAQNQADSMDGEKTVLDTVLDIAPEDVRPRVRNLLGSFLFSGEDVDKKVKVLSGGEKGRLALCKLLLQPVNVLIMDEPTNHLDMQSKEVLKESLKQFDGTLILVSHDRDFLQGLSEKVYEFREGKIKEYLGDIQFFLDQRKLESFRELELKKKEKALNQPTQIAKKDVPPADLKQIREQEKQLKKLQQQLEKLEIQVEELETHLSETDEKLLNPDYYAEVSQQPDFFPNYEAARKRLETLMSDWEKLQYQIDAISKN